MSFAMTGNAPQSKKKKSADLRKHLHAHALLFKTLEDKERDLWDGIAPAGVYSAAAGTSNVTFPLISLFFALFFCRVIFSLSFISLFVSPCIDWT
jgi:hypothetical protein